MARDRTPAGGGGQGGQGWQFWSIGGIDDAAAAAASANHAEVVKPSTSKQIQQTSDYPNKQGEVKIPISSSDGLTKKDGWQFWALGDQDHDDDDHDDDPTSTLGSAPIIMGEASAAAFTTAAPKKGWKFWAIGVENEEEEEDDHYDKNNDTLFSNNNHLVHRDQPAVMEQKLQDDSREDECAWRYWSQMQQQQQQHREEEPRRRSSEFDSKEAWQFWAIGVSEDNASQISLLTEGFETMGDPTTTTTSIMNSPTTSVKIVKIKKLMQPIEPLDHHEIGWLTMKKDAALKKKSKKKENSKTKQGWQFWAIEGANKKKTSMDQEFIASKRFEVEQPSAPIVKPVAPTMVECDGWRYWSRAVDPTENNVTDMTATNSNVNSKKGWQFWAIDQQHSTKGHLPSAGLQQNAEVKTKSTPKHVESLDESGWRYWSQIKENDDSEFLLKSTNIGKKQGWQFWSLGVSNNQHQSDVKSLLSRSNNHNIDPPATKNREPAEELASSRDEGGWRYWSRIKKDNHEDLLQREDDDFFLSSSSPFSDAMVQVGGCTTSFSANPKFYSLKSSNSLSRIEEEERGSKDDFSCDDNALQQQTIELKDSHDSSGGKSSVDVDSVPSLEGPVPKEEEEEAKESDSPCKKSSSRTITAAADQKAKSSASPQPTRATTTNTIQEEEKVSNTCTFQNLENKSLPTTSSSLETQKEKHVASNAKEKDTERIIPKRGILPKDWIHKNTTITDALKQRTQRIKNLASHQERYHQEASRLYAQAQERKRQLRVQQQQLQDDLVEFEDVVLQGIAVTATHAANAIQYAVSTCFRKKAKDDDEDQEQEQEQEQEQDEVIEFAKPKVD